jgi:DNA-binding MarR family transcriptional regulator
MNSGPDTKPCTVTALHTEKRLTTKSPGSDTVFGRHFETVNLLDALHTEAENIADSVSLVQMRVLSAIAQNEEQTRQEIAKPFLPLPRYVVVHALNKLCERKLIEKWEPGRLVSDRVGKLAICYRLTDLGRAEIRRITRDADAAFHALFRGPMARKLVMSLGRAQVR